MAHVGAADGTSTVKLQLEIFSKAGAIVIQAFAM
jgi:hypothetical protein